MDYKFIEPTKMLNYKSPKLQELIQVRKWNELDEYGKIEAIYGYVQNEILFGYNRGDTLTAEQVLEDGYGQCNTKTTLLMALLRGVGVPCRIHGFEVSKKFQRGATTALISFFAPKCIIHTWAEVYYNGQWLALEGVITDLKYFQAVKERYPHVKGEFKRFAIATNDFQALSIEWRGNATYVQSAAIVTDLGVFGSPDDFFLKHQQHWCKLKNFMYVNIGRKVMNRNVQKMRNMPKQEETAAFFDE